MNAARVKVTIGEWMSGFMMVAFVAVIVGFIWLLVDSAIKSQAIPKKEFPSYIIVESVTKLPQQYGRDILVRTLINTNTGERILFACDEGSTFGSIEKMKDVSEVTETKPIERE
jgi:hypothetical protein